MILRRRPLALGIAQATYMYDYIQGNLKKEGPNHG